MSKQIEKNLFIVSSWPALYQHLISGVATYQELGNRILKQIKVAHAFRQVERVKELARILINIPIREHQLIAQYYLVWCKCRELEYHNEILERVIEQTRTYKAKSLSLRAAHEVYVGHTETALYFYNEALKSGPTLSEHVLLSRSIATLKSVEGFHKSALKDLENLLPLIRYAEPVVYFDYLNSYAVELGEAGRTDEARYISQVVINSPFAFAYPEWRETAQELQPANRSFAVIRPKRIRKAKLLQMPKIELGEPSETEYPASVVNLQDWKANMGKKKNGGKGLEGLDSRQLLLKLMELGVAPGMTDAKLYKVIVMMEKLLREPDKPQEPDDDDPGA